MQIDAQIHQKIRQGRGHKASAFSVETKAACYRLSKLMFLSTYEGVRFIVFAVAVQRDRIHKSH